MLNILFRCQSFSVDLTPTFTSTTNESYSVVSFRGKHNIFGSYVYICTVNVSHSMDDFILSTTEPYIICIESHFLFKICIHTTTIFHSLHQIDICYAKLKSIKTYERIINDTFHFHRISSLVPFSSSCSLSSFLLIIMKCLCLINCDIRW